MGAMTVTTEGAICYKDKFFLLNRRFHFNIDMKVHDIYRDQ